MPADSSSAGRPTTTARPSTVPCTPRPSWLTNSSTAGSCASCRLVASAAIARATGCSDAASSAPTSLHALASSIAEVVVIPAGWSFPVVTVPVLSRTIVSTRLVDSRTSGPRMIIPSCAPRPVPTIRAVGVARPSAQGQAMIRTATAAVKAEAALPSTSSQAASVQSAMTITTGTKIAEIRSASLWTGALPV